MTDDDEDKPPHLQKDARELARRLRYEQRRRAYFSDRGVDGRCRVDDEAKSFGADPLLEALKQGKR